MTYQAKNNAFSTLAGAITDVATGLTVQAGHGDRFPAITAPDYTVITLEDASGNLEVVKVTNRVAASDVMTIVRAQEGTTARAWAAGDSLELRMTAAEIQPVYNHIANLTGAHLASAIENTPAGNLAADNVQAALNELQTDVDTRELSINAAAAKVTPVNADTIGLIDSAAANVLKKVTWDNVKATLKTYFDSIYATVANLNLKANSGANSDITSLSGLTTALSIAQGGTGQITAALAFTALKQAASETATGVVELATSAEVKTGTDTARAITPAGFSAASLGYGQTWQDVSASRALITTYTNSTGRPIQVGVGVNGGSANNIFTATVGGVVAIKTQTVVGGNGYISNLAFVVPNGVSYTVTQSGSAGTISSWAELR